MGAHVDAAPESVSLATPEGGFVVIHAFPNEARFVRDIRRVTIAVAGEATSDEHLLELILRGLRSWYPRLEIRPRDDLAGLSPGDRVWYCIRDGRIGKPRALIDRLHGALADARETYAESDRAVGHARAALARAERPRGRRGEDGPTAAADPALRHAP